MPNLLFCAIPLHSKDFYLTINIIDLIISIFFSGIFMATNIVSFRVEYTRFDVLFDLLLFVFALLALINFFQKRYYRSDMHKIYMFTRLFLTLTRLILISMAIFTWFANFDRNNRDSRTRSKNNSYLIYMMIHGSYQLLSSYWSFQLMKIIN